MHRIFTEFFLSVAVSLCLFVHSVAAMDPQLQKVSTFAFAAGVEMTDGNIVKLGEYDLIAVDGENVSTHQIASLKASGTIVLGYLTVGTIEPGRYWYKPARRYRLGKWGTWNEWYADVNRSGYRRLIYQVSRKFLRKGFDGLFLDNVDMIQEYRLQRRGMKELVRQISVLVHSDKKFLFSQNGERATRPMVRYLDGWNREDVTLSYDFENEKYVQTTEEDSAAALAELKRMKNRGLFTSATDYLAPLESELALLARQKACLAGAVSYVSDIGLTVIPDRPYVCNYLRNFPPQEGL